MASQIADTVRAVYERWAQGDFTAGRDLFDPEIVFVLGAEFPESGAHLGHAQVARYMKGFLEPWEHLTIEATEILTAGDSVVVGVRQRARGSASGSEVELSYFHAWTFRGPTVVRFESIRRREDALAAVGL